MRIEWDQAKSDANEAKHGVRFQEAAELLRGDAGFLRIYDHGHSEDEDRFIALGRVGHRLIVVIYAESGDDVLRIISTREATKMERGLYEDYEKARFRG